MGIHEITQFLKYDPDSGLFTWYRISKSARHIKIGDIAGHINSHGYIQIKFFGRKYQAHRLAYLFMTKNYPEIEVDHINGLRHDNRFCNLRLVSHSENCHNIQMPRHNTSGYVGVSWHKKAQKWAAVIRLNGKSRHLGLFTDPEEAHRTYLKAKAELHPTANLHRVATSVQHLPVIG
jgi:hypothetical protein